ncbi:unnamed protein product [Closterium sp. Yama58-4]|nr:unnamed protein product [Closterium sp. Yama58-4]
MSKSNDKKKEKTALLDGLVTDLFNRVEKPIEYHKLSPSEHMDSITAIHRILSQKDVGLIHSTDVWFRAVPSLILAMHLLFEKVCPALPLELQPVLQPGSPSKWLGYIKSLPGQHCLSEFNQDASPDDIILPLAFSLETVSLLQGTTALPEYHRMLRTVAKQYCHMRTVLRQLGVIAAPLKTASREWFCYADSHLIPFVYMFNRSARVCLLVQEGPITSTFGGGSNVMEVTAKRNFKAGEQVYLSYGYRPNTIMLLYSGFIPSSNDRDRFRIPLELSPSDPLYNKKLALLKWLELPPSTHLDLFWTGKPSPELATWLRVATTTDEAQITEDLRAAIAARAKETAELLEAHGKDKATANGHAEPTSKPASSADVTLTKAQAALLSSICQRKLQELQAGAAAASPAPAGLGLGGGLDARSATAKACEKELQLARQLREAEEGALRKAVELCVDPRLLKLLTGDVQICSSFVNHRECLDILEQMICATGCNPVPGFEGSIGHYFNSAEMLITIMFGRVGHAFNALNYTVQVSPSSDGTDKCYNGPSRLPEINACCDPLPVTPECPLAKLNVSRQPQTLPFIGRTIADPSCPTAQSSASAAAAASSVVPPPPSPPKSAARNVRTSLVSGMGGFSLFALAAAAPIMLLIASAAADSSSIGSPPPSPPKSAERGTSLVSEMVGFRLFALAAAASFLLVM